MAEDPATGSGAGPLAVHLARHGAIELGTEIEIVQGVEMGRPSYIDVKTETQSGRRSILVSGACVPVMRGTIEI